MASMLCSCSSSGPVRLDHGLASEGNIEREERSQTYLIPARSWPSTTPEEIMRRETVKAVQTWSPDGTYMCIITGAKPVENQLTFDELTFYENKGGELHRRYRTGPLDWFYAIYPLRDFSGNHLVTERECGNSVCVVVFSEIDGDIRISLDLFALKSSPEFADLDDDGVNEIIVADGGIQMDWPTRNIVRYPESATIYKWNGTSYGRVWTGPWRERLGKHTPETSSP